MHYVIHPAHVESANTVTGSTLIILPRVVSAADRTCPVLITKKTACYAEIVSTNLTHLTKPLSLLLTNRHSRLIERGFNQSHEIAKTFAKWMNVPLRSDLIYRNRDTEKQSTISFKERKNNVQGAFSITRISHAILKGTHIGLVDDVMTTGHTLEEIAHLLKNAGTRRVTNFVFARTPA